MTITTEEFWSQYLNQDILDVFELTCNFFSKDLPEEFVMNYDVGEVLLETRGHHETAKKFDEVIKFSELIQRKHPELYEEYFEFFDKFLIDYYCFYSEYSEVEKSFSNFISNPIRDFDLYLISFKKLLFYGHTEILNTAIIKNYNIVESSESLIQPAGFDLALCKFHITLEEFYQNKNSVGFDKKVFLEKLDKYGFDFTDDLLLAVETGMQEQYSIEKIASEFLNDRQKRIVTLEICFLKYMYKYKFPFALSGFIWYKILTFWVENNDPKNRNPDVYFNIRVDEFEKYLSSFQRNLFIDNTSEMIATLWGSVYVYDFLKSIEIIKDNTFNNFIEISKILKGKVIAKSTRSLWNSNFVHLWKKPNIISTTEFSEEEKIFRKSIHFTDYKFTRMRSKISEELANIGELSDHIIEGGKNDENNFDTSLLDAFFNGNHSFRNEENGVIEPIKSEKKVGRNEPCPCGSGKKYKKCCGKRNS